MTITYKHLGQCGRLGNQLWQIASTVGIAKSMKEDVSFPKWDYQRFFHVPEKWFTDEDGVESTELVSHLHPAARPYLQDMSLFNDILREVREWFSPTDTAKQAIEACRQYVSLTAPVLTIHVRRGDNVSYNDPLTPDKYLYHPLRSLEYYEKAMELLQGEYKSVAVFSDDRDWCINNIPADYYHIGTPRPKEFDPEYTTAPVLDWIDLFLMAKHGPIIISNSTYAWWGAMLGNSIRKVVYPTNWFGPKLSYIDESLMFPKNWIQLEDKTSRE